jgi:arabinofuranosyltransferase
VRVAALARWYPWLPSNTSWEQGDRLPTLSERADTHYRPLLALLLVASGAWAWSNRFLLDDAFISLRYARNWVAGNGLVWNLGEPVEGYTNFLWTLILAWPLALGIAPEDFVFAVGPLLAVTTLFLTSRLGCQVLDSRPAALVAVLLVASNFSFSAFATGGLETALAGALVTGIYAAAVTPLREGRIAAGRAVLLSLVAAGAALTRLDSALAWLPILLLLALQVLKREDPKRAGLLCALVLPGALLLTIWLAWKLSFYGSLLPNTFFAKTGSASAWLRGGRYLWAFVASYWLLPALLVVAAGLVGIAKRWQGRADLAALGAGLVATWLYLVSVGGGFMEFRYLVPSLPLLAVLGVWSARRQLPWSAARWALAALVLGGSIHHTLRFERRGGIESVRELAGHLDAPHTDWIGAGRALARGLPEGSDVMLAVTTAGAIPYYAGLPTLDMLGLNDPWVARNGIEIDALAGHTRLAPFRRLVDQGVHLVIGHPWVLPAGSPARAAYRFDELARLYLIDAAPRNIPAEASMVEVPLPGDRQLVALYLHTHPDVEAAIAAGGWRRVPLRRPRR